MKWNHQRGVLAIICTCNCVSFGSFLNYFCRTSQKRVSRNKSAVRERAFCVLHMSRRGKELTGLPRAEQMQQRRILCDNFFQTDIPIRSIKSLLWRAPRVEHSKHIASLLIRLDDSVKLLSLKLAYLLLHLIRWLLLVG